MPDLFLSLAVPILLLLPGTKAEHATCSWQPWKSSPAYHRFYLWCHATFHEEGVGRGRYLCDDDPTIKVADYGFLRQGILEAATPCGGNGYAWDTFTAQCDSAWWAICPTSACEANQNCLYIDDCEWPTAFNDSTIYKSVEIWAWL